MEWLAERNSVKERVDSGRTVKSARWLAFGLLFGVVIVLGIPVAGQSPFPPLPSTGDGRYGQHSADSDGPFGKDPNSPEQKRLRALNAQRQKDLVSDTEKLLKLAKELNEEMAQDGSGNLKRDQLHKVEEIAKLAKSVREKMSFTASGFAPLTIQPPIQ